MGICANTCTSSHKQISNNNIEDEVGDQTATSGVWSRIDMALPPPPRP